MGRIRGFAAGRDRSAETLAFVEHVFQAGGSLYVSAEQEAEVRQLLPSIPVRVESERERALRLFNEGSIDKDQITKVWAT